MCILYLYIYIYIYVCVMACHRECHLPFANFCREVTVTLYSENGCLVVQIFMVYPMSKSYFAAFQSQNSLAAVLYHIYIYIDLSVQTSRYVHAYKTINLFKSKQLVTPNKHISIKSHYGYMLYYLRTFSLLLVSCNRMG